MDEPRYILETFDSLPPDAEAVLATVVDVIGSGYRRPGARMLITRSGRRSGGISGGCLEGDLARRCWDLTARGPLCVDYDTHGDIERPAGPYDTGCEGLVRVLVERIAQPLPPWHPLKTMRQMLTADDPGAAATVYGVHGGADRSLVGQRMVLDPTGRIEGDLRAMPWQAAVRRDLEHMPARPRAVSKRYRADGGGIDVLLEPLHPPRRLVIFGAGDDVRPVVSLAATMGWRVTVIDKRPHLARRERFPEAAQVMCLPPERCVSAAALTQGTAVVLMTHSLTDDEQLLPAVLETPAAYVGLLGPTQRAGRLMAQLHRQGRLPPATQLDRLSTPVGLDLGSPEPAGVALAVLAEIEASFNDRDGGRLAKRTLPIHEPHERVAGEASAERGTMAGVILAAGASKRLGRPKQIEPFNGTTLLGNAVMQAVAAGCDPVVVVTGFESERVAASVAGLPCRCVANGAWESGMGSSVHRGIAALSDLAEAEAEAPEQVLLMVCDQPLLAGEDLRRLAEAARSAPSGMAATSYDGDPGVPACISWRHRERLMQIDLSHGARVLLRSMEDVALVDLPHAEMDIDDPAAAADLRLAISSRLPCPRY